MVGLEKRYYFSFFLKCQDILNLSFLLLRTYALKQTSVIYGCVNSLFFDSCHSSWLDILPLFWYFVTLNWRYFLLYSSKNLSVVPGLKKKLKEIYNIAHHSTTKYWRGTIVTTWSNQIKRCAYEIHQRDA